MARRIKLETKDAGGVIVAQEHAKRAICVAAVNNHSILFRGPKGSGKTMLRALAIELGVTDTFEILPCKCGNINNPQQSCDCTRKDIQSVWRKSPVCDIVVEIVSISSRESMSKTIGTTAKQMQKEINSATKFVDVELDEISQNVLKTAKNEIGLSQRQQDKIIIVARSIANLDQSEFIQHIHLLEAIHYRDRNIA